MNRNFSRLFIPLLFIFYSSCTKEPQDIEAINLNDDLYIEITDTIKPQFSVYRVDSFQTSGSNTAIIGNTTDPAFGNLSATAYCRFKLSSTNYESVGSINEYYDSLVLIMHTDHSWYGDTSSEWKIKAEQLEQEFDVNRTAYYNHNSLSASYSPLGTASLIFRPNVDDSIRVKLDNSFGAEIFSLYKTRDNKIKTGEEFQRYFKGLRIIGEPSNNVIYRFNAADSGMLIRLYYHEDHGPLVSKFIDFPSQGGSYQFNHIECDVAGTSLADLQPGGEINSSALNNRIFINDLAGIGTKIKFPSVPGLAVAQNFVKLAAASLEIKPVVNTYEQFPLIDEIRMNISTEEYLNYTTLYAQDNTTIQNGNLSISVLHPENTKYTYDLSAMIRTEMYATPVTSNTLDMRPASFYLKRLVASDCRNAQNPSVLNCQLLFYKQ